MGRRKKFGGVQLRHRRIFALVGLLLFLTRQAANGEVLRSRDHLQWMFEGMMGCGTLGEGLMSVGGHGQASDGIAPWWSPLIFGLQTIFRLPSAGFERSRATVHSR